MMFSHAGQQLKPLKDFTVAEVSNKYREACVVAGYSGQPHEQQKLIVGCLLVTCCNQGPIIHGLVELLKRWCLTYPVESAAFVEQTLIAASPPKAPNDIDSLAWNDLNTEAGALLVRAYFEHKATGTGQSTVNTLDLFLRQINILSNLAPVEAETTIVVYVGQLRAAGTMHGIQTILDQHPKGVRLTFFGTLMGPLGQHAHALLVNLPPAKQPATLDDFCNIVLQEMKYFLGGVAGLSNSTAFEPLKAKDRATYSQSAFPSPANGNSTQKTRNYNNSYRDKNSEKPSTAPTDPKPAAVVSKAQSSTTIPSTSPNASPGDYKCTGCDIVHPLWQHRFTKDDPRWIENWARARAKGASANAKP